MDLWVIAAVAGAGYLGKYWQHVLRDKEGSSGFTSGGSFPDEPQSPSLIERIRDKACPIKKLSQKGADIGNGDYSGDILSETSRRDGPIGREGASSSALNHEQEVGRHDDRDGFRMDMDMSDIPKDSTWKMGASSKKSRRSRRFNLQCIKPRSSLDSCLLAQMHIENAELEEYLLTPLSSPCTPSLRPFIVSDGKRIISRPSGEFIGGRYTKVDGGVVGVPCSPQVAAAESSKQKFNRNSRLGKLHYSSNRMQFDTQSGFSNGQALFCLGVSIGILSTIIANKVELEKFKVTLKQSENLVEDLKEELEMKDSLTVKELVNDDDSQGIHGILSGHEKKDVFTNQADMTVLIRYADEKSTSLKKDASISNIEAELEAELERLELSMKGSTLSSEFNQGFDQDTIAELVCGDLQADIVPKRSSSDATVDRGSHGTPAPHLTKDGVSPRLLSLRLHEVIQSRLEKRVMELETELARSQNHIKQLLSERTNYYRDVSNSGSSSSISSPRATEALVMNLSGDALDAYNEAFEELSKISRPENELSQIMVDCPSKPSMEDGQTGFYRGSNTWSTRKREEAVPISITGIPSSEDSLNDCDDGVVDNDDDDMLLIMQIVEKARRGSPAILKAQKAMVSLNRDH